MMAKVVVFLVLFLVSVIQSQTFVVNSNAEVDLRFVASTETKTFFTIPWRQNFTWMKGQEACNQAQKGMKMAALENDLETNLAMSYLESTDGITQFMLSATDYGSEGEFHWTKSGNPVHLQPVYSNNRERNCLTIQENWIYFANPCDSFDHPEIWALCEIASTGQPSPTPIVTVAPTTTELPTTLVTTPEPVVSTTVTPFVCPSAGKHPDPVRCNVFHECVADHGGLVDFELTCPEFTNYCAKEEICGTPEDCPCTTKDTSNFIDLVGRKLMNDGVIRTTDMELVGTVGSKTFYTAKRPNENWIAAMEFCHQNEMMLARMESEDERNLLYKYLNRGVLGPRMFWLSAVDYGTEGQYYWFNKGTPLYMDPYGNGGLESNCLYLYQSGPVYDWSCENHQNYDLWPLCQVEANEA